MADIGYDFSTARPSIDALKAAGATFVMRYLCYLPNAKALTSAELSLYLSNGLDVGVVWEQSPGDMKYGAARGSAHAAEALQRARTFGLPAGTVIYFACDWDATPQQQAAINDYLTACRAILAPTYRTGIYGGYYPVKRALDAGACDEAWQTYAWSGGQWDSRAALRQVKNGVYVDGDCDRNERYADGGLCNSANGPVGPGEDEPMATTLDQVMAAVGRTENYAKNVWLSVFFGGQTGIAPDPEHPVNVIDGNGNPGSGLVDKLDWLIKAEQSESDPVPVIVDKETLKSAIREVLAEIVGGTPSAAPLKGTASKSAKASV